MLKDFIHLIFWTMGKNPLENMKMETAKYGDYWIDDGIVYFVYAKGTMLDFELARKIVGDLNKFLNGEIYPSLVDINGVVSADKLSRDYIAEKSKILFSKVAFISSNTLSNVIGNFFLEVNKPEIPVKLFSDKQKALAYLSK
jgi:hypothetical protein